MTSVSASSAAGSESRDDPAAGVAAREPAAQQRAAKRDAELAVAGGVGPTDRARVPAAVEPLERRDQPSATSPGSPPTAGVGCSTPASSTALSGVASWARIGDAEVLDVRDAHERRLGRGRDPDGVRAQRAGDPAGDDLVLLAVLVAAQQLLAKVVVDRRVGAAARGARERDGARALAVAADEQLGAGRDERRVAAPDREHVTGGNASRSSPKHGAGVVVDRGA